MAGSKLGIIEHRDVDVGTLGLGIVALRRTPSKLISHAMNQATAAGVGLSRFAFFHRQRHRNAGGWNSRVEVI